jgi:hypothetical protein
MFLTQMRVCNGNIDCSVIAIVLLADRNAFSNKKEGAV